MSHTVLAGPRAFIEDRGRSTSVTVAIEDELAAQGPSRNARICRPGFFIKIPEPVGRGWQRREQRRLTGVLACQI
jgi:hypothetical protein